MGLSFVEAWMVLTTLSPLILATVRFTGSKLLKERPGIEKLTGVLMGFVGIALLTIPKLLVPNDDWLFFLGGTCLLGKAVCWSLYTILSGELMKKKSFPIMITAYTTIIGTMILLPLSITSDWGTTTHFHDESVVEHPLPRHHCGCGAIPALELCSRCRRGCQGSVWLCLEPVAAFVREFVLSGSAPSPQTIIGGAGIVIGALLSNLSKE